MGLTDEEFRDVLARAEEIDRAARHGDEWNAELAAVVGAAEEVGLSRQAVERALAERFNLPATPPVVGSLAWARSADWEVLRRRGLGHIRGRRSRALPEWR